MHDLKSCLILQYTALDCSLARFVGANDISWSQVIVVRNVLSCKVVALNDE